MSDLDNMLELDTNEDQPTDDVELTVEESTSTPPDSDTETELVFDEDEGDHETPNSTKMDADTAYAAFRAEKKKRQNKNKELEEAANRERELIERLAKLEREIGNVSRGSQPDIMDFDSTNDYIEALDKWRGSNKTNSPTPAQVTDNQNVVSSDFDTDDTDRYRFDSALALKSKLADFDAVAQVGLDKILNACGNQQNYENYIVNMRAIAKRRKINIAKAEYAIGKSDILFERLKNARDQFDIEDVLRDAAGKIKPPTHKNISAKPTATVTNGPAGGNNAAILKRLQKEWRDNPTDPAKSKAYFDFKTNNS